MEGEQEELGSGEIPEGLQEEGEESREESEADELGETLPDSTPWASTLDPLPPQGGTRLESRELPLKGVPQRKAGILLA